MNGGPADLSGAFLITDTLGIRTIQVYTTDQKFALEVPSASDPYMTEYTFTLTAKYGMWPLVTPFSHTTPIFWIKDYCAGMQISGPPVLTRETTNFVLTDESALGTGSEADPWVYKV